MASNEISTYLKYANVQMAAEAFLDRTDDLESLLKEGNKHASKFPPTLAAQFIEDWAVVAHQPNTETGFSATLFRCTTTDPARGLTAGEYVLSFRSTEFVEDQVRDSGVTNKGIAEFGWAFGQIADLWAWWETDVQALVGDAQMTLTGYSLGSHLAYAFDLLLQEHGDANRVSATYTFNGAGVGEVTQGTLTAAIDQFKDYWKGTGTADGGFTDPYVRALYQQVAALEPGSLGGLEWAQAQLQTLLPGIDGAQAALLKDAIQRAIEIQLELDRVRAIAGAADIPAAEVAGAHVSYWVGVLRAGQNTRSVGTTSVYSRQSGGTLGHPVFDIYGRETANYYGNPSAVANSQLHFGEAVPVYIESQPLWRGTALGQALRESLLYWDMKLLVDDFEHNDFGDTHSLVLLVDSLAVLAVLARLAPNASQSELEAILGAATVTRALTDGGTQGKAEGDTLETVVDALVRVITGDDPRLRKAEGLNEGNTWHEVAQREDLHRQIALLGDAIDANADLKLVSLLGADAFAQAAGSAPDALAYRYALRELMPFAVLGVDYAARFEHGELELHDPETGKGALSREWLADRARLLSANVQVGQLNLQPSAGGVPPLVTGMAQDTYFEDMDSEFRAIGVSPSVFGTVDVGAMAQIRYGHQTAGATLAGGSRTDRLYGGAGDDRLEGGADNDTLIGGVGADWLYGGFGNDRYEFSGNFGTDIVGDDDGQGTLWIGGVQVKELNELPGAPGVWRDADERFQAIRTAVAQIMPMYC